MGAILDRFDACILSYCRAIFYWQQNNKFCGVCGSKTAISKAGHQIDCKEITCRKPVFPRTDPAVIMLVYDDDRILLGRQSIWKKGMYSTLAGFLEPGETLEEAVAREVFEEANIEVEDVSYHSSQPWPFPASIMLGFMRKLDRRKFVGMTRRSRMSSGLLGARLVNFQNSVSLYLEKIQSPVV